MSIAKPLPPRDANAEIAALIETLHATGQRLEDLTAGEVDGVADREGRTFLLRHVQEQLRHNEAAKQTAILNALPAHIALLDRDGRIVSVNEAWRKFAGANGLQGPEYGIGVSYLGICDQACGDDASAARQAAAGIRSVLRGELGSFSLEYPCHSPTQQRWFLMMATPLAATQTNGAVVMHLNMTTEWQADTSRRDAELKFRQMAENIRDVFFLQDAASQRIEYVSPAYATIWGRSCASLQADPDSWAAAIHPDDRAAADATYRKGMSTGKFDSVYRILRPDGAIRWIEARAFPVVDAAGKLVRIAGVAADITERQQTEIRIKRLNRVYAVLSGINSLIVRVRERGELFAEACRIAVEAGAFRMAWVGVLDPQTLDGKVVAWYGGAPGYAEKIALTVRDGDSETERPACRALRLGQPVICNDIATEPALATRRDGLLGQGFKSLGSFPLTVAGQPEAVIVLLAGEIDFFDAAEMPLLLEMAGNLSFALDHIANEQRLARLDAARKRDEEALRRFSAAMDAITDALYLIDRSSMRFVHVNDAACRFENLTREELMASDPWALSSTTRDELERTFDAIIASGETAAPLEIQRQRQDGSHAWIELRRHAQYAGDRWTIVTQARDITERKKADARITYLNRVHAVLSGINTLIVRVQSRDELFRQACLIAVEAGGFHMAWIGIVDPSVMRLLPVASAGVTTEMLTAIKDRFASSQSVSQGTTMTARALREKVTIVANDSQNDSQLAFPKEHAAAGIRSLAVLPLIVADEAIGVLALYASESEFFQDEELKLLTELAGDIAFAIDHIGKQEQLDYLAYYDALTGLANRRLFLERIAQYMRSAAADGKQLAIFLTDLERFKNINDSLGRAAGDELLRQVAEWLTRIAGDANLVARVGPDVFAVVLPEVRQDGNLPRMIEKMIGAFLEHPFHLTNSVFRIAARGGVALFPDDAADAEALFRNAEAALKKAKARGERYLFYTQAMTAAVAGKLTLENQLRQALDNGEFVLHYQPKVNLASGRMTAAEALIRWNDPRTGLVPPGRFIPILEETGLIYDVGRWALRQAITDYLRWRNAGLPAVRIAVNVSPLQLRNRGFIAEITQAIAIDAQAAAGLELEITESLIMEDVKHSIASLNEIRAMGISIAIDDFGTGFSSLSYLARLPVDTLKIDRSFVIDMTVGPEGLALVSTIINLAHSLKLKVVAEGVETEEQSRLLRLLGCDEMQGYLFSQPVPGEVFESTYLTQPHRGQQ